MHCTVEELGERLTAQEFGEWLVMAQHEDWLPSAARLQHAELLAAVLTGAAMRQDKQPWSAHHFLPTPSWQAVLEADRPPPEPDIEAQVALINQRMLH